MALNESSKSPVTDAEALEFHARGKPGKIEIHATKPLTTQRDLSLAYSPGVAAPVRRIAEHPESVYDYTARGNLVAVISNGTAILGLGDLGALASKPVMEGKAVLFKRFADIDAIDLEVDTKDVEAFINAVRYLGPSFGGINLEDIKAPDCFIIEERLKELLDIPVFHDDQHGTAIIASAGLINALELTGRKLSDARIVINGAGSAGIACTDLLKTLGVPNENITLCDTKGVIWRGRQDGMNQWKSAHAVDTSARTLAQALEGADVFFGLSAKGAVTAEMVKKMARQPIIFAMANPDPEITPEEVRTVSADAIVATGRSDYPNQVNNVLGFPYIFRGALDVRARAINDAMKLAAVHALAKLAKEDVPDEVDRAYSGRRLRFGPEYIIPVPFDPRLIEVVPAAVARAAMDSGVARRPVSDMRSYRTCLRGRLDPTASSLARIFEAARDFPRRIVFAEGEDPKVIRAALSFRDLGLGTPILIGREEQIAQAVASNGLGDCRGVEIQNSRSSNRNIAYAEFIYKRLQRRGFLLRDCQRMINTDRNSFAAAMVMLGEADGMVTGVTRSYMSTYEEITRVIPPRSHARIFGLSMMIARGRTVFISDTTVHELPTPEQLADIAIQSAAKARLFDHEPRVALLSFSNFGQPMREKAQRVRDAVLELDGRQVDFEYDGEMSADVALDYDLMRQSYPFCRLSGPANVLVMPALHTANIAAQLLRQLGGGVMIGPMLIGLSRPAQIVPLNAAVTEIVTAACLAAYDSIADQPPAKSLEALHAAAE